MATVTQPTKTSVWIGCVFAIIQLTFVAPLFYAIVFGVLQKIDAPVWMWICFWLYLPVSLLASVLKEACNTMAKGGD
jgi:hypothetical protein